MSGVYIHGVGVALGSSIERNDPATLGRSEQECERLVSKIGVYSRPIAGVDQYTSDLAFAATAALLQETGTDALDIGALMVCTQTPDHLIPGVSSRLHGQLQLSPNCFVLDINQGCSGFVIGTQVMTNWLRSSGGTGVLVNADTYSKLIRPDDFTTRTLFGDAAAATLYSTDRKGLRIIDSRSFADGSGYNSFVARRSALHQDPGSIGGIFMDGPGILNFAMLRVPEAIATVIDAHGIKLGDLRMILFHQANSFVVGQLKRKLRLAEEQVPQNCATLGNTVSASIPLLLREQMNQLQSGDLVLAVGFGVGFSWGCTLLEYIAE